MATKTNEIVQGVKDWALKNYSSKRYAWDQIVECWSDREIAEVIIEKKITNLQKALTAFREIVGVYASHRNEIMATAF